MAAVIFGYMVMMVFVIIVTVFAVRVTGQVSGHPTAGYLVYNVVVSLLAALLGGFVTGSIAAERKVRHGIILAMVMLVMAALSYTHFKGQQPPWYQAMLVVVPPCVAVAGSWLAEVREHGRRKG